MSTEGPVRINADLGRRVVVDTTALAWAASPSARVRRRRLYCDGPAESARVTSIVHYDAGAAFRAHEHPAGEEILVLNGTFSDETGDHPAGTYLLNPDGSRHAPFSHAGCTLFVRLRQHPGRDRARIRLETARLAWQSGGAGIHALELHRDGRHRETATLVRIDPGAAMPAHSHDGMEEIYVLAGTLADADGTYPAGTWIRNPPGSRHARTSTAGATILVLAGPPA
ncbi:MAG: cupin [Alphaproteobacteria bacterium]|nr:cupin [Alphaproteobacteria bacterium]